MCRIFAVVWFALLVSCNNNQQQSELESRLDNLEQENKQLKARLNNQPEVTSQPTYPESNTSLTNYVFVKLLVELQEYDVNAGGYITVTQNVLHSR